MKPPPVSLSIEIVDKGLTAFTGQLVGRHMSRAFVVPPGPPFQAQTHAPNWLGDYPNLFGVNWP